jgi:predicted transcriptional regulator YdeE
MSGFEIKSLNRLSIVGFKVEATWEELHRKMPKAWQILRRRFNEIENRKNNVMLDVSLKVEDGTYTQFLGAQVDDPGTIPEGMEFLRIPQQQYVHYRHQGPVVEIASSFGKMYEWGKGQNIRLDEFKLDVGYTAEGNEQIHDLYVRVVTP